MHVEGKATGTCNSTRWRVSFLVVIIGTLHYIYKYIELPVISFVSCKISFLFSNCKLLKNDFIFLYIL